MQCGTFRFLRADIVALRRPYDGTQTATVRLNADDAAVILREGRTIGYMKRIVRRNATGACNYGPSVQE